MKAVLLAQEPDTFVIQDMHDNAEQVVSSTNTTSWRWTVTAKKEGLQTLDLIIYQLVKYDDKEFWHEVETYNSNIVVYVTVSDWIKSLDWKWIASVILIPLIAVIWSWIRNKKSDEGKTKRSIKKAERNKCGTTQHSEDILALLTMPSKNQISFSFTKNSPSIIHLRDMMVLKMEN